MTFFGEAGEKNSKMGKKILGKFQNEKGFWNFFNEVKSG